MATVIVTTSQSTTVTKESPSIHFDPSYARTIPGLIKIAEAVLCLIGFICVNVSNYNYNTSATGWYSFVSMTGFWICVLAIVFYLFHIIERLQWLPWLLAEMVFAAVWCIFFFIAGCVAASKAKYDDAWGAAAFFGFAAMCVFAYEAYINYFKWRSGGAAQGERTTTNVTSSSNTGPSYPTY